MIQVNQEAMSWEEGMTIQRILELKNYRFPLLVVSIGDTYVDRKDYEHTSVPDGADVKVIHMLSGG